MLIFLRLKINYSFQSYFQLETLDLSGNYIKEISLSINNLYKLKILNLTRNRLSALPEYLYGLYNLQKLDLSKNDLTHVLHISGISKLPNLKELHLSHNALRSLDGLRSDSITTLFVEFCGKFWNKIQNSLSTVYCFSLTTVNVF